MQQYHRESKTYHINDINTELITFWKCVRDKNTELIEKILNYREKYQDGKKLYYDIYNSNDGDMIDIAAKFFILNKTSFSGLMLEKSYSPTNFRKKFTLTGILNLRNYKKILKNTLITNEDYSKILHKPGKDVFIFLDPPYFSNKKMGLYGRDGKLHSEFDHYRLANELKKCPHKWLITYDLSDTIKDLYDFANITEFNHSYGMRAYKNTKHHKVTELIISNYQLPRIDILSYL